MSQSFYPDAVHRPLQVSFWLCNGVEARYHETELAKHDPDIQELFHPPTYTPSGGLVVLDGYVSVTHHGRELVGQLDAHWIEFIAFMSVYPLFCDSPYGPRRDRVESDGIEIRLVQDGLVLSTRSKERGTVETRLPARAFTQEWTLMLARVDRVRIELGDRRLSGPRPQLFNRYCQEVIDMIDPALLDYTSTTPLGKLLADPVPAWSSQA